MQTLSTHILSEYHGCPPAVLDDLEAIRALMHRAAQAAECRIVQMAFHRFAPQGVSGVVVIEESHISIHTWPEYGYATADFFTCGDCRPEAADRVVAEALGAERVETMNITRGLPLGGRSMRVQAHTVRGGLSGEGGGRGRGDASGDAPPRG